MQKMISPLLTCTLPLLIAMVWPLHVYAQAKNLNHAIEQVQEETEGRILAAETVRTRGGGSYRIKVLTPSGRVQVFQVPMEQSARSTPFFPKESRDMRRREREPLVRDANVSARPSDQRQPPSEPVAEPEERVEEHFKHQSNHKD